MEYQVSGTEQNLRICFNWTVRINEIREAMLNIVIKQVEHSALIYKKSQRRINECFENLISAYKKGGLSLISPLNHMFGLSTIRYNHFMKYQ